MTKKASFTQRYCGALVLDLAVGFFANGFAAGLDVLAAAPRSIVMWLIFTGRNGRLSRGSLAIRAICLTIATVASSHWPKIVWRPFR